jgi:transcriptional regulator with XRE-family HTH domain
MEDLQEIVDRIKSLRHKEGLTQQEFAKELQLSRSIIATLESYRRKPSLDLVRRVSVRFNISLDYILDGKKEQKQKNQNEFSEEI